MSAFSLPLLWVLLLTPLLGALSIGWWLSVEYSRRVALSATTLTSLGALWVSYEFFLSEQAVRFDPFDVAYWMRGAPLFRVDELSIILLLFASFTFLSVALIFPRTERRATALRSLLLSEVMTLGSYCTQEPSLLAFFWLLSVVIALRELRAHGEEARKAEVLLRRYMGLSAFCLLVGVIAFTFFEGGTARSISAIFFTIALLIRKGIIPFHSWMPEFFAKAPLGLAILFSVPQLGSYLAIRVLIPLQAEVLLTVIGVASLLTAVYSAGISLVQRDARSAYGFLFMSQSALVLTGIESLSELGFAGSIALWISGGLSLTGFGLTLWVLEARRGAVSLHRFHGWYERMPSLAASFLLLGLASVGFPGTFGFIGGELLIDGALGAFVYIGFAVVLASALNGINVLRMYFTIFCGAEAQGATSLQKLKPREHLGFFLLVSVLLFGGLFPKTFVASIGRAVEHILHISSD